MARQLTLPDGRALELHELGDPDGFPVVVHHGTPASGQLYDRWATAGVRLIGYDRAGYGGSDRNRGRSIAAVAGDMLAVADALGFERFATWGSSGGGPHALACAALCGERVVAAATVASIAPYGAEGLDWFAGMGEDNVREFGRVLEGEAALAPSLASDREQMLAATPEDLFAVVETLLGAADRAALTGVLAEFMHTCTAHGLEHGADGWVDDDLAFAADWGFDVTTIATPVLIVQGGDDRFVPKSHGEWLAAHVPGCEAWIDDENGHLTLLENRVAEVHEWLLSHS